MTNNASDFQAAVGFAAGEIFHSLEGRRNGSDLNTLRKELSHLDEPILYQGMGWLMREDKLQVRHANGTLVMSVIR